MSAVISTDNAQARSATPQIWWSNAIFFIGTHLAALAGVLYRPWHTLPYQTIVVCFASWQLAEFGITIGYHRLWSHRSFKATKALRVVLAVMGSMGFQGSIKARLYTRSSHPSLTILQWWCLRHRLHHRFTDDPVHDPYSATRGLLFSHVGWIFYKPVYQKLDTVGREDLEHDPVVRFQHKYFVYIALASGLALPTALGYLWNDPLGAYIWGGLVARVLVWHCTFLINSLAHWEGLQRYTNEVSARGDFIMALLTSGEGNHNFHAFPHDFRSGPRLIDWDPSKWLILILHQLGLVHGLRRAREQDITTALKWMNMHGHHHNPLANDGTQFDLGNDLPTWAQTQLSKYIADAKSSKCVLLIDGWIIDASQYLFEHPGGAALLQKYSVKIDNIEDASWAFGGGLNNHSRIANGRMRELRIARLI